MRFFFIFILLCVSCAFKTLCGLKFFLSFWKTWGHYFFKHFFFSSLSCLWDSHLYLLVEFILFHRTLILLLFSIYFFSLCFSWIISIHNPLFHSSTYPIFFKDMVYFSSKISIIWFFYIFSFIWWNSSSLTPFKSFFLSSLTYL